MAQARASRTRRRARPFARPAVVAKREESDSFHPELRCSETVEYAFRRLPFHASKSQAERSGVSCKLIESSPFISWLHFDKAAHEIKGQICAYPVLLRRWMRDPERHAPRPATRWLGYWFSLG